MKLGPHLLTLITRVSSEWPREWSSGGPSSRAAEPFGVGLGPSPTRRTISASHPTFFPLPVTLSHCPHMRGGYIAFRLEISLALVEVWTKKRHLTLMEQWIGSVRSKIAWLKCGVYRVLEWAPHVKTLISFKLELEESNLKYEIMKYCR